VNTHTQALIVAEGEEVTSVASYSLSSASSIAIESTTTTNINTTTSKRRRGAKALIRDDIPLDLTEKSEASSKRKTADESFDKASLDSLELPKKRAKRGKATANTKAADTFTDLMISNDNSEDNINHSDTNTTTNKRRSGKQRQQKQEDCEYDQAQEQQQPTTPKRQTKQRVATTTGPRTKVSTMTPLSGKRQGHKIITEISPTLSRSSSPIPTSFSSPCPSPLLAYASPISEELVADDYEYEYGDYDDKDDLYDTRSVATDNSQDALQHLVEAANFVNEEVKLSDDCIEILVSLRNSMW
jgi:hypothetical protein